MMETENYSNTINSGSNIIDVKLLHPRIEPSSDDSKVFRNKLENKVDLLTLSQYYGVLLEINIRIARFHFMLEKEKGK